MPKDNETDNRAPERLRTEEKVLERLPADIAAVVALRGRVAEFAQPTPFMVGHKMDIFRFANAALVQLDQLLADLTQAQLAAPARLREVRAGLKKLGG